MIISIQKEKFLPHVSCHVQFDILPGELLLIRGENGIGKSTLAEMISSSYSEITSLIRQAGLDLFYDRKVSQIKKLYLDAASNMIELELFHRYWKLFKLDQKEDRLQSALSGGEEQMLKICLGAFLIKEIIIFDEPSQSLDTEMKKHLNELMSELKRINRSLIVIEHEINWMSEIDKQIKITIVDNQLKAGI